MTSTTKGNPDRIGMGVIGCGGFGLFALQHFAQVPGVYLAGMSGTHREAALAAAQRFGLTNIEEPEEMLAREDIDIVYIATPPFLHHEQALLAINHGKHVICEKPLAVSLQQADEMISLARTKNRLVVANLMQRYNPLFESVKALIHQRILGDLLHGYFENYAADEGLSPQHWFWNRELSGGIFIEHGVHFFDLFAGWFGEGEVVSAQSVHRPGTEIEEQVHCTVSYQFEGGAPILVNFYHGFHQPGRLDRQELRLVFERGELTLFDWIPSRYKIHAIADESQTRALCELFPDNRLDTSAVYSGAGRLCRGRNKELDVYQSIVLTGDNERPKLHRYGDLLRALLADQVAWIRDPAHHRKISEVNGRNSLKTATLATALACNYPAGSLPANPSLSNRSNPNELSFPS